MSVWFVPLTLFFFQTLKKNYFRKKIILKEPIKNLDYEKGGVNGPPNSVLPKSFTVGWLVVFYFLLLHMTVLYKTVQYYFLPNCSLRWQRGQALVSFIL